MIICELGQMGQVSFMHDLIQVHKVTNHGFVLERESWIELSCFRAV